MSADGGPSAGDILLSIFLILCGLCLTLLGGGCTIFWIWAMFGGGDGLTGIDILLLLVSLAALVAGVAVLRAGGKVAFGKM